MVNKRTQWFVYKRIWSDNQGNEDVERPAWLANLITLKDVFFYSIANFDIYLKHL